MTHQVFDLKPYVFSNKSHERYSRVLAQMVDPLAKPDALSPWRRGPDGCAVVFTPQPVIEAILNFHKTGALSWHYFLCAASLMSQLTQSADAVYPRDL